jgi:hypothetical protein
MTACKSRTYPDSSHQDFYNRDDFYRVEKIDAHVHVNRSNDAFVNLARQLGFRLISINVDYPDFPPIDTQQTIAEDLHHRYPREFAFASTFSMDGWEETGWLNKTLEHIRDTRNKGAIAVKVWKNVGMDFRGADGQLVMIDDKNLTPVFDFLEQEHLPLIGHQAEPKNCWLPLEEMTVNNDRQYFAEHPQYHMHNHPEFPGYDEHMDRRNRMLEQHSSLQFMGAHMASLEWSVDELAQFLDRYPNAVVDIAARIGQLQFQSMHDYDKVRNFFIRYHHRILYATDLTQPPTGSDEDFIAEARSVWLADWQYFTSDDEMNSSNLDGPYKGLKLPAAVVDDLYHNNARRFFEKAFSKK